MFFNRDEIQAAKTIDLLTYMQRFEPQELVHISGNSYCTRTHDSLKISNGKWYWFSRGIGGRSALDYLIKVKGRSFPDAVGLLLGNGARSPLGYGARLPPAASQPELPGPSRLILPEAQEGYPRRVVDYLTGRGISRSILEYCIEHKLLYESKDYHNAVFVGYDADGVARSAALRGTAGIYKGEATGSSKRYSFSICPPTAPADVHVFESAIDLLSFATLEERAGRDWHVHALLSLAGVFAQRREKVVPVALRQFLGDHPTVHTVCLHLDNDPIGRSAANGIIEGLSDGLYEIINSPPRYGKDMNDQLQWERLRSRRSPPER